MQPTAPAVGERANRLAPKGRQKLAPKIFHIVSHIVFLEERQELVLKRMLFVMFLLTGNIFGYGRDVRFAGAEHAVSGLPGEI